MLQGEAFFHRFNARMMRSFIERFVIFIAHSTISYRLWDDGWEEAYSTMWLYSLVILNIFEFAFSSSATHIVDGSLHLDSFQASLVQGMGMWTFYTSAALLAIAAVDVHDFPDSQEYIEKLAIVSIIVLTTVWRLYDIYYMEETSILATNSRVTGTNIFLGKDKVTTKNGKGGYNVSHVLEDQLPESNKTPPAPTYRKFQF